MCDGDGAHLCEDVLAMEITLGMEIVLRVPNLSYILQGEDTVYFKELKVEWRIHMFKASNELNKIKKTAVVTSKPISFEHLMLCYMAAWDKAFGCVMRNRRRWELEGIVPFNRYAMWRKRGFSAPGKLTLGRSSWKGSSIATDTPNG